MSSVAYQGGYPRGPAKLNKNCPPPSSTENVRIRKKKKRQLTYFGSSFSFCAPLLGPTLVDRGPRSVPPPCAQDTRLVIFNNTALDDVRQQENHNFSLSSIYQNLEKLEFDTSFSITIYSAMRDISDARMV